MELSEDAIFEDKANFPLTIGCPKCRQKQVRTLGELRQKPEFACNSCGKTLSIGLEQVNGVLAAIQHR